MADRKRRRHGQGVLVPLGKRNIDRLKRILEPRDVDTCAIFRCQSCGEPRRDFAHLIDLGNFLLADLLLQERPAG